MRLEGIRLLIKKLLIQILKYRRNKIIKNKNFTIISNNCWGGMVYESLDLPKQSPTVGLFFMADEYIKFLCRFPDILKSDIRFIDPNESKYREFLKNDKRFGSYPIGLIDDVEIAFLHYHSREEVIEKWKRRVQRVNFNKILFKMNDQNMCTDEHVKNFLSLDLPNKVFFTARNIGISDKRIIKCTNSTNDVIYASQEPVIFTKFYDVISEINKL